MKKILIVLLTIILLVSCSKETAKTEVSASETTDYTTLSTVEQYYYAIGNYFATTYGSYYADFDYEAFSRGAADAGKGIVLTEEQQSAIVEAYSNESTKENREKAEKFLAENAKNEGVVSTASGLQYKVITKGNGLSAANANTVTVDYELTLTDGSIADSSIQRGTPAQFPLDSVIKGFSEAIRLMNVGDTITAWIHPDLGYGSTGTGNIPGNELLTFTISLISIDN